MLDTADLKSVTCNVQKRAYELSIGLVKDYVSKPVEDVMKTYSLDISELRKIVYNNLPNVLKFEPELIKSLDIKRIAKPTPNRKNKYTVGLRDWMTQFIVPTQDVIKYTSRFSMPSGMTETYMDNLLVLNDKIGSILEEGVAHSYHIESPRFSTIQVFVVPSKMDKYGFTEQTTYESLGEVIWRVLAADRTNIMCYELTALKKEVQSFLVTKVGSSKQLKSKLLLSKPVVSSITSDIVDKVKFVLYPSTYTAHLI